MILWYKTQGSLTSFLYFGGQTLRKCRNIEIVLSDVAFATMNRRQKWVMIPTSHLQLNTDFINCIFSLCIAHYALSYKFSVLLLGNILRCFYCVHAICYNKLSKYYSNPSSVVLLFTFFRHFYRHFLLQVFLALVLLLLVSEFSSTTRTKMTKTAINYCVKLYTSVLKKACYKSHIKDTQISKCT